ncbi:MAG TPA: hypothetical protein VK796_01740 [Cytophaga sp.]|jgi:hypothetical protein|nr:hypothetical protein [Cytophaga sp.]
MDQSTYRTDTLLKWLLAASLLLSIFTLSGYVGTFTSVSKKTVQTESVFYAYNKTEKTTLEYKSIDVVIPFRHLLFFTNPKDALFAYDAMINVKLDALSDIFYYHTFEKYFLQAKSISQNSDEHIFETRIG